MIKLHRTRETADYQYISYHSSMKLEDQNYTNHDNAQAKS